MISLQEAQKLTPKEITKLQEEIQDLASKSRLNAYIKQPVIDESTKDKLPILIKDNISVANETLTCASKILQGYIAPYDATVITRLKEAGMTPFGRANMDEFAMGSTTESSFYGPTLNPKNIEHVCGGSSGGSAAAVAGDIALAALGSDTGGSIRQPAGFCGCVGLKPTYGRVSRYGLAAYSSSLDVIGPITHTVGDAALLLDIISGYDGFDSTSLDLPPTKTLKNLDPAKKAKIAYMPDILELASPEVQKTYAHTIELLKGLGHTLVEKKMGDLSHHISTYYIISTAEASSNLARYDGVRYGRRAKDVKSLEEMYVKTRSEGFGQEVQRRILLGCFTLSSGYYDAYYIKALKARALIRDSFAALFSEVDLALYPIAPKVAPRLGASKTPLDMYLSDIYTISVNLAGIPAICLPIDYNDAGLPISMQLLGGHCSEQMILDVASGLEEKLK